MTTRNNHADACPSCGTRDQAPASTRHHDHALIAVYRCRKCRHGWWTSWDLDHRSAA